MPVIFGLIALFGWGVGDLFFAISTRKIGNLKTIFWQLLLATILTTFYIPFVWPVANLKMLVYSAFLGFLYLLGSLSFFKGLEVGNPSLVGAVAGAFPAIVVLLSKLFYKEELTLLQTAGVLMILAGLILVSLKGSKKNIRQNYEAFLNIPGLTYALITTVLWGFYFTFVKTPVLQIGWFWPTYTFNLMFIFLLLYSFFRKKDLSLKGGVKNITPVFTAMILTTLALFAYNAGVSRGLTSIVAPIAGSYPILFVLLVWFIFRESLTRRQTLGIISALTGIVLISFS